MKLKQIFCTHIWINKEKTETGKRWREWNSFTCAFDKKIAIAWKQECIKCSKTRFTEEVIG